MIGPNRLRAIEQALEMSQVAAIAFLARAHAYQAKRMKAYKVTLPPAKAAVLDTFLHEQGITLSAFTEGLLDSYLEGLAAQEHDFRHLADAVERGRTIVVARRARGYGD